MSELKYSPKTLTFFSVLYREDILCESNVENIIARNIQIEKKFNCTFFPMKQYYSKEMGSPLQRLIFCSREANEGQSLVPLKQWSQSIEEEYAKEGKRVINIDPGIITLENLVLATGKPYSHRLYLGENIYAELTYIYKDKSYQTLPWTYPDYGHKEQIEFFHDCRKFIK